MFHGFMFLAVNLLVVKEDETALTYLFKIRRYIVLNYKEKTGFL
jgi:hypothetical protein